jgi:hypothetical protein
MDFFWSFGGYDMGLFGHTSKLKNASESVFINMAAATKFVLVRLVLVLSYLIIIIQIRFDERSYSKIENLFSKWQRDQISTLHRIISDASTILLLCFPPYSSSRILNFPLPLCTIFASNPIPSMRRKHQHE